MSGVSSLNFFYVWSGTVSKIQSIENHSLHFFSNEADVSEKKGRDAPLCRPCRSRDYVIRMYCTGLPVTCSLTTDYLDCKVAYITFWIVYNIHLFIVNISPDGMGHVQLDTASNILWKGSRDATQRECQKNFINLKSGRTLYGHYLIVRLRFELYNNLIIAVRRKYKWMDERKSRKLATWQAMFGEWILKLRH